MKRFNDPIENFINGLRVPVVHSGKANWVDWLIYAAIAACGAAALFL